ncbi:CarD family transcriptional regulator, partial [Clostridium botulinum]
MVYYNSKTKGGYFLFNIGDKIVYPSQGVGIIELIGEMLF